MRTNRSPKTQARRNPSKNRGNGFKKKVPVRERQNNRHPSPPKTFIAQNRLRTLLEKVKPRSMRATNEIGTGVDFIFAKIKIDQKFSFGELGENVIKIRVRDKKLLNKSQWTMCIAKDGRVLFFPTRKLANYVISEAQTIKNGLLVNKQNYSEHAVSLKDFFASEFVTPITCSLTKNSLIGGLKQVHTKEMGDPKKKPFYDMFLGAGRRLPDPPSQLELSQRAARENLRQSQFRRN